VKPHTRELNHTSAIVTLLELCVYLVLGCVLPFAARISLLGEVNQIVTQLIIRGDVVLQDAGFGSCDLKPDRCVASLPNRLLPPPDERLGPYFHQYR
jgi:hypothetical protein